MEKYREGQKEFHPVALHKAYNRVPKEELHEKEWQRCGAGQESPCATMTLWPVMRAGSR